MKERFDDEKLYDGEWQCDSIVIRNYKEVLRKYSYKAYVRRFRGSADRHQLSAGQRPKLEETEFLLMKQTLLDAILNSGEENLLTTEKNEKAVARLLLTNVLDEEEL